MGDKNQHTGGMVGGEGKLLFGPAEHPVGFASEIMTGANAAGADVIIRELIQNALDAVEKRPDRPRAEVEFIIREMDVADIPCIEEVRSAFRGAVDGETNTEGAAAGQIERIRGVLAGKKTTVLEVRDNGIGLDRSSMNALHRDGRTDKIGVGGALSAGSYGLGHHTTFGASDLQMVFYGGVDKGGNEIASAHVELATHRSGGELKTASGRLITTAGWMDHIDADDENWFDFPAGPAVPAMIRESLREIGENSGSGSVIIIPGFNNFRQGEDGDGDGEGMERPSLESGGAKLAARTILGAAARHFFPAIHEGRLEVAVQLEGGLREAAAPDHLERLLAEGEDHEAKSARAAYRTLVDGEATEIDIGAGNGAGIGKARFFHRPADPGERIQLSIYRNGMFIVRGSKLPRQLQRRIGGLRPFVGLLLFDPPDSGGDFDKNHIYAMLRASEGKMHLEIDSQRLEEKRRPAFNKSWLGFAKEIARIVGEPQGDEIWSDITVPGGGGGGGTGRGGGRSRFEEMDGGVQNPRQPGDKKPPGPRCVYGPYEITAAGKRRAELNRGATMATGRDPDLCEPFRYLEPPPAPAPDDENAEFDENASRIDIYGRGRPLSASEIIFLIATHAEVRSPRLRLLRLSGADQSCDKGVPHVWVPFSLKGASDDAPKSREAKIGAMKADEPHKFELLLGEGFNAESGVFELVLVAPGNDSASNTSTQTREKP